MTAKLYLEYDGGPDELLATLDDIENPRGVWNDVKLKVWNTKGGITVFGEPYPSKIGPASIDLAINHFVSRPRWWWCNPVTRAIVWFFLSEDKRDMKKKKNQHLYWQEPKEFNQTTIWPGEFVLMSTIESVHIPDDALGLIRLKSTSGRQGFESVDAGIIDPGFNSNITLEFFNVAPWPIRINKYNFYVQMVMFDLGEKSETPYRGRYQHQGDKPVGPREEVS